MHRQVLKPSKRLFARALNPTLIGIGLFACLSAPALAQDGDDGVSVEATYSADVLSAVDGGISSDAVVIQQSDVGVFIEMEKFAGL